MRIKHYIVTYRNNDILDRCLRSIFSTETEHERIVYVIGNHTQDSIRPEWPAIMLRNDLRPDFSTGHLSRNWNQALINGFVNLKNPDADLVIACQNDCEFAPDYLNNCIRLHERFDMVTYGEGDNCISYSPRAVARIGLWDERFCNIGYQEADYFLRAALYLGDRVSINDGAIHGRQFNPVPDVETVIRRVPTGCQRHDEHHMQSMHYHRQSQTVFRAKWGDNTPSEHWGSDFLNSQQRIMNHIYYPYFERDVETLNEQQYLKFP